MNHYQREQCQDEHFTEMALAYNRGSTNFFQGREKGQGSLEEAEHTVNSIQPPLLTLRFAWALEETMPGVRNTLCC